jgi:GAF domain-containing protein
MSPSVAYWIEVLIGFGISLVALTLLLLVLGAGIRRRLHQTFGLFAASAALVGLGSALSNVTFWLVARGLAQGKGLSDPLLWRELAAIAVYFASSALFAFAIVFTETSFLGGGVYSSVRPRANRWYKALAAIGFLVGFGLVFVIFNHQTISQLHLSQAGVLHLELTSLGYEAAIIAVFLSLLALNLFWQQRRRPGGTALTISTAIWLVGSTAIVLVAIPSPVETLTLGISTVVIGYVVVNCEIFSPLRSLTQRLEATVAERTEELQQAKERLQRLNEQQRRVAQISREIAQISDPTAMLAHLVQLIHNRLGYHHIYVFEPDHKHRYLGVQAAAGTTARTVMDSRHQTQIGGFSLTGQAAAEHRPRIAENEGNDAIYFGDTALPGARAEIAVPLLVSDRLLGVLDIQSIHLGAFSDEDLALLTTLADQVAVTIDNCRLLQETQAALAEAERIQRQFLHRAWRTAFSGPENALSYIYTDDARVAASSPSAAWSPEMTRVAATGQTLTYDAEDSQAALALPVTLRGQVIGAMELRHKPGRAWNDKEIAALGEVAERLGPALETARLLQESQQRAARERLTVEITARLRETLDVETVLKTAVDEIYKALGLDELSIHLSPELAERDNGDHNRSSTERTSPVGGPLQTGDNDV